MDLLHFDVRDVKATRRGMEKLSHINFRKDGKVYLSSGLVAAMGLKEKDRVRISQDQKSPDDWYVSLDPVNGFILYKEKSAHSALVFVSKNICEQYKGSFEYPLDESLSREVDPVPIEYKHNGEKYSLYKIKS